MMWSSTTAAMMSLLLLLLQSTQAFQHHLLKHPAKTSRNPVTTSLSTSQSSSSAEDSPSKSSSTASKRQSGLPKQQRRRRRPRQINKDVVIVGGGLSGLSAALYLSQIDPDRHITVLERNAVSDAGNMASLAAAGMLAPHSERLPRGAYLDLCMASKKMFAEFAGMVESLAQEAGPEGAEHLQQSQAADKDDGGPSLEPWNIGYVASGGFLAPAFAGDNVATWAPPEGGDGRASSSSSSAIWLDATQVRELEPHLHPDVIGGWWFPEDASVDAQRLTRSLKAACVGLGVEFLCGPHYEVTSLDLEDGECSGLWLKSGKYVSTKSLLVANGAWMRNLLPVPLEPHKGQSLSLRMPKDRPPILRRVLFAQDSYIVPKADGRIVIGATVEAGSFDANVTPAGIMHILSYAMQLVPGLADLPLEDTWAGLRPTTPDKGPILGETPWKNLFLAGGNWRNGVLLAPKTGHLLASLIATERRDEEDPESVAFLTEKDKFFLKAFAWDRFTSPEGAKRLAANTRYAASMYPVHTRRSGVGVAAAVGTELGSYSTARLASEERRKDRDMLFGASAANNGALRGVALGYSDRTDKVDENSDEAFERAAQLGLRDAAAFSGLQQPQKGGDNKRPRINGSVEATQEYDHRPTEPPSLEAESSTSHDTMPYDGSADAFTVGTADVMGEDNGPSIDQSHDVSESEGGSKSDLQSIYKSIAKNKSKQNVELPERANDDRPDPGFRIYHLDKETGKQTEVPPYTPPGKFLESLKRPQSIEQNSPPSKESMDAPAAPTESATNGVVLKKEYDETTYDGYQAILEANGSSNRKDELKAMREARRKNRALKSDSNF